MNRSTLAARLIRAGKNSERRNLLAANSRIADARLARELKDFCYRVWTSEPADAQKAAAALKTLAEFAPEREIRALHRWIEGVAEITKGKLESAVTNLDAASRLLVELGREHESAQPQVAKLIALAMLGRYEAAQRTGEKALGVFKKHSDQLAAGKIEMNLSNIVSRRDQYRLAEKYCLSAYRRFKRLGEKSWQTMAENGLANTYAELNDFKKAEEYYGRALATARGSRMHVTVAEVEASMGNLALFRGRYGEAVRMLESSRQKYEKLGMPHQTAIAELEIADIYAEMNLVTEASAMYQRLIPTLRRLKMRAEEARARANFGRSLIAAENFQQARKELRRAAELFDAEGNSTAFAATRLRLASLELTEERYDDALAIATDATEVLDRGENIRLQLAARWLRGEILSRLGKREKARSLLETALKGANRYEQPAIAQASMNSLGVIARDSGDDSKAEALFEAAIQLAEAARAPLPGEEFRMAFLAKSLAPFENLSRLYFDQGNIEKAFVAVERARARSLLDAIGTSAGGRWSSASAEKFREELNWLYSRSARADAGEDPKLQKQISVLEKRIADLALRQHSSSRGGPSGTSDAIDLSLLQKRLGENSALIEFVEDRGDYSAFVVTDQAIFYVERLATEDEILSLLEGLHFQFGTLRFGAQLGDFASQLKTRADLYLNQLFEKLLKRLAVLVGSRNLVIVPAKALNYVPFNALYDGERYAVEAREISCAPSAAVWLKLRGRRQRQPANSLLMANTDEQIPLASKEVRELAKIVPDPTRLEGKRATFAAFRQNAPNFDLIHLACHGQFRPDNPTFSSLHLADGWITVSDVYATKLRAELVTLSACETGLNKVMAGEEILGLARGFLSAGARSLVLSLWTVNDSATAMLMKDFYSNLQRGLGVSASLVLAQREFIGRGEHPYYWSPFFVIG